MRTSRFVLLSVLALVGCDGDDPPRPTTVEPSDPPAAQVGTTVQPTFTLLDQNGEPLGGVPVTITVVAGGGTLTGSPTQTEAGPTPVGSWTLGPTVGLNQLEITVEGLDPVRISTTTVAGPPAQIVVVSGGGQEAPAGGFVPLPIVVAVQDAFGNSIPGVTVTFTVVAGGGSLDATTAVTDAQGRATVPRWRVGKSAVAQRIQVSADTLTTEITVPIGTSYTIEVRFFGEPMSASRQALFTEAAARIAGVITGDLQDVIATNLDVSGCASGATPLNEPVDDLLIFAAIQPIDGRGSTLASAGPCFIRSGGGLPVIGVMQFDVADIETMEAGGFFFDVILHEMLHVVGFGIGQYWDPRLLGKNTENVRFTGAGALAACQQLGGTSVCADAIPVENQGGIGTAGSHWRESVFNSELMTGYAEPSGDMPLSLMTARSLADIGYVVNTLAVDPYAVPGQALRLPGAAPSGGTDRVIQPIGEISPSGAVSPIRDTAEGSR